MSFVPVAFLDANVLFSAALGGPSFRLLLDLADVSSVRLMSSVRCEREAATNIDRKRPDRSGHLLEVLKRVEVADPDLGSQNDRAAQLVPASDVHVLAAALALRVTVLLTGDVTHFGHLMDRRDLPLTVRTVRCFLLAGPSPGGSAPSR